MGEKVDLLIRNARLYDSKNLVDIAIKSDKIVQVDEKVEAFSKICLDVKGRLTSPGFVDAHTHLNLAFLGGSEIWGGRKLKDSLRISNEGRQLLTLEAEKKNARKVAEMALMNGTTALRAHVSIDGAIGLKSVEIMLELKKECSRWMDIQVVAFMTELPLTTSKIGKSLLRKAINLGADVIGGLPYLDPNPEGYFDLILNAAKDYDVDVDLHVDETNNPEMLTLETYAEKVLEHGYEGRAAASHCCSLSAVDDRTAKRAIGKVKKAKMSIIANPLTNLYLQSEDGKPNGVTRVRDLLEAGVDVIYGTDNTRDPFNPLGNADMLSAALILAYSKHLGVKNPLEKIFEMGTTKAAEVTKVVANYGIKEGGRADLLVLEAESPEEAIINQSKKLYVIKNGRLVVKDGTLNL